MSNQDDATNTSSLDDKIKELTAKIADITNESGKPKYDSLDKAVDSIPHKEEHIKNLEAQVAELKGVNDELAKKAEELSRMDDLYNRISDKLATTKNSDAEPAQSTFDEQGLASMVERQLEARETKVKREVNVTSFLEAVNNVTTNAEEFIARKAKDLGIGVETMYDLIGQNANSALQLVGVDSVRPTPEKTKSNLNTAALPTDSPDVFGGVRLKDLTNNRDKVALWNKAIEAKQSALKQ